MSKPNADMRKAWDGLDGDIWAAAADQYETRGAGHRRLLLQAAAIASGERVLDLGCGNGASTREAARMAEPGEVVGIDLSTAMLTNARARSAAAGLTNVSFVHGDAQVHDFGPESFDVIISNAGAMFFDDKVAAFSNLRRALRPGGRIVLMAWQLLEDNEWLTVLRETLAMGRDLPAPAVGMPGPFGLSDRDQVSALLSATGFTDVGFADVREPMVCGATTDEAYALLSDDGPVRGLLADLSDADRATALDKLRAVIAAHETPTGVIFGSASWLIQARRPAAE
jgi:SAM-dependent methyltransferase